MEDETDKRENQTEVAHKKSREVRLKQALRENLKRRKSQSKGRIEATARDDGAPQNDDEDAPKT